MQMSQRNSGHERPKSHIKHRYKKLFTCINPYLSATYFTLRIVTRYFRNLNAATDVPFGNSEKVHIQRHQAIK